MLVSLWVLTVNKVGRCERFVLNTLFLSLVVSLWQRSFQKYQQKNHYQKFPQKNLVCMSCPVHLRTVRFFNPFFVVPKNIHTHPIVDFLDLNCSFVSYYPFKIVFQVRPPFTLEYSVTSTLLRAGMGIFWNHTCCRKGCWPSLNVCLLFFFFQQLRKDHRRKRKMKEKQKWSQHYRHSWSVSIMMIKFLSWWSN